LIDESGGFVGGEIVLAGRPPPGDLGFEPTEMISDHFKGDAAFEFLSLLQFRAVDRAELCPCQPASSSQRGQYPPTMQR
jgi:hypothetical protein